VAQAAIRLGYNQRVALEPTMKVGFRYDPVGKIVFYSNEGDTFSLGNDGSFRINGHESRQLMFLKATGEFEVGGAKGTMMKLETTGQFRVGDGSSNLMVLTPSTGFWIYNNVGQTLFYAPSNISDNFKFGLPKTAATAGVFMGYWLVDLGGFERAIPFYNAA
jgi:hypothetical protein